MLGIPTVDKMPRYTLTNVAVYVYVTRRRAEAMYALDPRHQALANVASTKGQRPKPELVSLTRSGEASDIPEPANEGLVLPTKPDEALDTPRPARRGPGQLTEQAKPPKPRHKKELVSLTRSGEASDIPEPANEEMVLPTVPDEALDTPRPARRGPGQLTEQAKESAMATPRQAREELEFSMVPNEELAMAIPKQALQRAQRIVRDEEETLREVREVAF
jgi:hypothetical protein